MGLMRGQGATEYLVLLAVVLIVALVSVALLGFFPGMAADAKLTQSQAYWQSAQPISIVESKANSYSVNPLYSFPYLRVRNSGAYPIRITKLLGGATGSVSSLCGVGGLISDRLYMAPGEEKSFGYSWNGVPSNYGIDIYPAGSSCGGCCMAVASSGCQNSTTAPGTLQIDGFGFEYIEYVDGQTITKRQVGAKPFVAKCLPANA